MAYEFYVTVEGTVQKKFKGESPNKQHAQQIPGLSFQYEVTAAHDASSGLPSGKRQHKPMVFVKEWGASTAQFFQALVNNENLKTVNFEFYRVDTTTGKEAVYYTIKLTNASVTAIRQFSDTAEGGPSPAKYPGAVGHEFEAISLTFQKIELQHTTTKSDAMDDWKSS